MWCFGPSYRLGNLTGIHEHLLYSVEIIHGGTKVLAAVIQICAGCMFHKQSSNAYKDAVGSLRTPFPQIDIVEAMMIVWRLRGKIIRFTLGSIVCNIICVQCNTHTYEQT